ncbi:MAG: hypothetical protein LBO75_05010, partial [Bifidobacteriaceae bacterium]|nr:hypothetical protein [Bifidobacteriaceae bacterium]
MGGVPVWVLWGTVVVGLAVSVLTAAGEAALQRLALAGDDDLAEVPPARRQRITRLLAQQDNAVAASAFARVFFQVTAGIALGWWVLGTVGSRWEAFGWALLGGALVAVLVALIRPRARAFAQPVETLRIAGPWLSLFNFLLAPLRPVLGRFTPAGMLLSPDELADLVENVSTTDEIAPEDREMLS